jgi:hypothetical protein
LVRFTGYADFSFSGADAEIGGSNMPMELE